MQKELFCGQNILYPNNYKEKRKLNNEPTAAEQKREREEEGGIRFFEWFSKVWGRKGGRMLAFYPDS